MYQHHKFFVLGAWNHGNILKLFVLNEALICIIIQVRFHVMSLHKLRSCTNENISSVHYLNMEQLTKALTTLFNLYDANRSSESINENEADFCSFYVLLHLGSNSQPTVDLYFIGVVNSFGSFLIATLCWVLKTWNVAISDPQGESLSLWFRQVPIPIIKSKEMCFARRILRYFPFAMIPFAFEVSCVIRFNLFRRIFLFFHFLNCLSLSLNSYEFL